jgi:thioredoxin 1
MGDNVKDVNDSNFESDVLNSDKPVLVDFWAPWCAPCRMLAPTVEAVAQNFQGTASVVKLNVDDNPAVSQRYGIKGSSSSRTARRRSGWWARPRRRPSRA